jgi:hypothetical protein
VFGVLGKKVHALLLVEREPLQEPEPKLSRNNMEVLALELRVNNNLAMQMIVKVS